MTTSGKLVDALSGALRLPQATIVTMLKGLRPAKLITVKGRGTSAAEMGSRDAAVLLMAIASGASTSYVATATTILMKMKLRAYHRPDLKVVARLSQSTRHPFYSKTSHHTFIEGLDLLIAAEIDARDGQLHGDEDHYYLYNAFEHPESLSLTIGMDLEKKGGFAFLQTGSWNKDIIFNCYSSWPLKDPKKTSLPDLFSNFDTDASFTIYHFKGDILVAAVNALLQKTKKTRIRKPRAASWGRR